MNQFEIDLIEEIKTRLFYDEKKGVCFWIKENKYHKRLTNKEAGTIRRRKKGFRSYIRINGISIPRARIAFAIMCGRFPIIVDHINGNTLDDRWINLREANHSQNNWNRDLTKTKPNGLPVGVKKMGNKYQARIAANKKTYCLGSFKTINEAQEAYLKKKKELHSSFFGRLK